MRFFIRCFLMALAFCISLEAAGGQRLAGRFFCDFRLIESGQSGSDYFDRIFTVSKKGGEYIGKFPLQTAPPFAMRKRGDVIFGSFESADSQKPSEEEHILYRYEEPSGRLVQSFVRYVNPEDYEKALRARESNPYLAPLSSEAAQFLPPAKEGLIRYGFDKSLWICRRVSFIKFIMHGAGRIFMQILGV